jgi:hypothetical protein
MDLARRFIINIRMRWGDDNENPWWTHLLSPNGSMKNVPRRSQLLVKVK